MRARPHRRTVATADPLRAGRLASAGLTLLLALATAGPAATQLARSESVDGRPRPEFTADGIPLDRLFDRMIGIDVGTLPEDERPDYGAAGTFILKPRIAFSVARTNNLFAERSRVSDVLMTVQPAFSLESDWANHSLQFQGDFRARRHRDNSTEDTDTGSLSAKGRIDVREYLTIRPELRARREAETRGSVDDPGSNFDPTLIDIYTAQTGPRYFRDAILVDIKVPFERFRYDTPPGLAGNIFRDRDEFRPRMRVGYEAYEDTIVFVEGLADFFRHRNTPDDSGVNRDLDSYAVRVGLTWDASAVTFVDASVGYRLAEPTDPTFEDFDAPDFAARVLWNATDLMTLTAQAERRLDATSRGGVSINQQTRARLKADYEVLYNVIASAEYAFLRDDLKSSDNPDEDTHTVTLKGRWLINEYFVGRLDFRWRTKVSDNTPSEFSENRIGFGLDAQL